MKIRIASLFVLLAGAVALGCGAIDEWWNRPPAERMIARGEDPSPRVWGNSPAGMSLIAGDDSTAGVGLPVGLGKAVALPHCDRAAPQLPGYRPPEISNLYWPPMHQVERFAADREWHGLRIDYGADELPRLRGVVGEEGEITLRAVVFCGTDAVGESVTDHLDYRLRIQSYYDGTTPGR